MKPDVQNMEIIAAYISEGHFDPLFHPEHLRGRVSYSWVKDSYNDVNYSMGTFYSYDAHGNVKTLFHDYHEGVHPVYLF